MYSKKEILAKKLFSKSKQSPGASSSKTPVIVLGSSSSSEYYADDSSSEEKGNVENNNTGLFIDETPMERAVSYADGRERVCIVQMHKSFVSGDCRLQIPSSYGHQYLKNFKDSDITLKFCNKSWDVRVRFSQNTYRLGNGWRKFVQDNDLCIDDVVVFEAKDDTGAEYKVSYFCK